MNNKDELILDYIRALVNLYGVVPKEKVVEIFRMQNEDTIDIDRIIRSKTFKDELFKYSEGYFIEESIAYDDSLYKLLNQQGDKPYYIPDKEELLKYRDGMYFERSKEYENLKSFIRKNLINDDEMTESLCSDIQMVCQMGFSIDDIMAEFERRKIVFDGMEQINELLPLIIALYNTTRLWENRGHTAEEIFNEFEKPKLNPLPKEPFVFKEKQNSNVIDINTKERIGRNEPCPCGSGKKYKKCCG